MRNLWDRLKPELKQQLEKEYENHHSILEATKGELSSELYYTNVRYFTYKELYWMTKRAFGEYEHDLNSFFLPE
jgi:hypothetical protein